MKFRISFIVSLVLLFSLSACGSQAAATPEALPTVVLGNTAQSVAAPSTGGVAASGNVVAAQESQMAFTTGGTVKTVYAAVGDQVKAGDLLVELDNTTIQLDVAQAERNLRELTSESAIAEAARVVATTRKALEDAQDKAAGLFYPRASDTMIDNTQAEIDLAKEALMRATKAYGSVQDLQDGDVKKASKLLALTNAQLYLNSLVAKYNWYAGTPTATDAALTQANLDSAKAAFQEAQWYYSALKGETLEPTATGARLAQLQSARDAITLAHQRLDATRLVASIDGTVTYVNLTAGEYVAPAQVQVVVSDIANLKVETTDLSERDVTRITVGQPVSIFVDALGETITGKVELISPVSNVLGGDVVYKTTIALDVPFPSGLRSGMSVDVQFENQ